MDKYNAEVEKLKQENEYLRKMTEQSIAKIMQMDSQAIAMRHELEQKRCGFALMAELAVNL